VSLYFITQETNITKSQAGRDRSNNTSISNFRKKFNQKSGVKHHWI